MAGITRIHITDPFYEDRRTELGEAGKTIANRIYRKAMANQNMPLEPGEEEIRCTRQEAAGRYDWSEGIDVILRCLDGSRFTLQEKFLAPNKFPKTITIEERKASGKPGAWYYCTAQLYFTAYYEDNNLENFSEWMLASLEGIRRKAACGELPYFTQSPTNPRRGGPFRCFRFRDMPPDIVIAQGNGKADTRDSIPVSSYASVPAQGQLL